MEKLQSPHAKTRWLRNKPAENTTCGQGRKSSIERLWKHLSDGFQRSIRCIRHRIAARRPQLRLGCADHYRVSTRINNYERVGLLNSVVWASNISDSIRHSPASRVDLKLQCIQRWRRVINSLTVHTFPGYLVVEQKSSITHCIFPTDRRLMTSHRPYLRVTRCLLDFSLTCM